MSDNLPYVKADLNAAADFDGDCLCRAALQEIEELEAKLGQLVKAATKVHDSYWHSTDGVIAGMYELEQALRIAELKGKTDD